MPLETAQTIHREWPIRNAWLQNSRITLINQSSPFTVKCTSHALGYKNPVPRLNDIRCDNLSSFFIFHKFVSRGFNQRLQHFTERLLVKELKMKHQW